MYVKSVFTVRLSKELKEQMQRFEHINWSEIVRKSIREEIKRLKMKEAVKTIDSLREKASQLRDGTIVQWIRETRERR